MTGQLDSYVSIGLLRYYDVTIMSRIWKIACFVNMFFLHEYFAAYNFYWKRMYNGLMQSKFC